MTHLHLSVGEVNLKVNTEVPSCTSKCQVLLYSLYTSLTKLKRYTLGRPLKSKSSIAKCSDGYLVLAVSRQRVVVLSQTKEKHFSCLEFL